MKIINDTEEPERFTVKFLSTRIYSVLFTDSDGYIMDNGAALQTIQDSNSIDVGSQLAEGTYFVDFIIPVSVTMQN